jgi:hypothetical protein
MQASDNANQQNICSDKESSEGPDRITRLWTTIAERMNAKLVEQGETFVRGDPRFESVSREISSQNRIVSSVKKVRYQKQKGLDVWEGLTELLESGRQGPNPSP